MNAGAIATLRWPHDKAHHRTICPRTCLVPIRRIDAVKLPQQRRPRPARRFDWIDWLAASPCRCLAIALAHLGREAEAREAAAGLLKLQPSFRIFEWTAGPRGLGQIYIDGLRKAGLPE
jgi:hypothetical protein